MTIHRVVVFEATADVLGTIRRVRYDLDAQRLSVEAINIEEALVMLQRLEAAAPLSVAVPKNEAELIAAMKATEEPKPSFAQPAVVTITPAVPEVPESAPAPTPEPIVPVQTTPPPASATVGAEEPAVPAAPKSLTVRDKAEPPLSSAPTVVAKPTPAITKPEATPERVQTTSGTPATTVVKRRQRKVAEQPSVVEPPPVVEEPAVVEAEAPTTAPVVAPPVAEIVVDTTAAPVIVAPVVAAPVVVDAVTKAQREREMAQKWLKDNAEELAKPPKGVENGDNGNGNGNGNIAKDFAKCRDAVVDEVIPGEALVVPSNGETVAPVPGNGTHVETALEPAPAAVVTEEKVNEHGVPLDLVNATSLREVLAYYYARGVTEEHEFIARCVAIKPHVGVIQRIINLEERIRRALPLMGA